MNKYKKISIFLLFIISLLSITYLVNNYVKDTENNVRKTVTEYFNVIANVGEVNPTKNNILYKHIDNISARTKVLKDSEKYLTSDNSIKNNMNANNFSKHADYINNYIATSLEDLTIVNINIENNKATVILNLKIREFLTIKIKDNKYKTIYRDNQINNIKVNLVKSDEKWLIKELPNIVEDTAQLLPLWDGTTSYIQNNSEYIERDTFELNEKQ